jgi:predicted metalloenzyme YecM
MILDNYQSFLDSLIEKIEAQGVDISKYELDHFGYQASSDEDYDSLKSSFLNIAELLSEEVVGGRRVGIFKFNNPLPYRNSLISAVELVAPKTGQVCPSALEHAEFIIDENFDSFTQKYPNLPWDKSKVNQPMFPMVNLKLDEYVQVKFHYKHVLDIVNNK